MGTRGGAGTRRGTRARGAVVAGCVAAAALSTGGVAAGGPSDFTPGADGIGDPYFPKDGNGGYDVSDYDLAVRYDHRDGNLRGLATITAQATQGLSRFNLDLVGLKVRSIEVDGAEATWRRDGDELVISPASPLAAGTGFVTTVRYDGVPVGNGGQSGFARTGDGAVVMGEPDVAASWFPVNDHPLDAASYSIDLTVRKGRAAISNGILTERRAEGDWTTWSWRTEEEIAPYLATAAIGKYETARYSRDGLPYFDAIERVLLERLAPRAGKSFAVTGAGGATFQRLTRTISVPRKGGTLSFSLQRAAESGRDFAFVEARPAGGSDWTTLPDRNGNTAASVGVSCAGLLDAHPFLTHYQTERAGTCTSRGSTGRWHASSGASGRYERWSVDLSRYSGRDVQVSISYASDPFNSLPGVGVDDIKTPGGQGATSFESDGDRRDGWRSVAVSGGKNSATWVVGGAGAAQPSDGKRIQRSLDRQPEIIAFLAGIFGEYPYSAAGGVVHGGPQGFALETASRPLYSYLFFGDQLSGDSVVVHELAHQWFGNSVALAGWQHIWLNEGFASYAEWLWSEGEDLRSADEIFAEIWELIPADEEFWKLPVGDPGPSNIFAGPIYTRGAMTLHQLRQVVGDESFFRTLRAWATERAGENVTTEEFIAVAERESGEDLGAFFDAWLFTDSRPELPGPGGPAPE